MTGELRFGSQAARRRIVGLVGLILILGCSGPASCHTTERVVSVGDENRDGRYTGADIEIGLRRCRPGCTMRIGAHRYDDVAVVLGDEFPDGLSIEGAGIGQTILRSPVPSRAPIFWVRGGPKGIEFRNLTLDGRRVEQDSSVRIPRSIGIFVVHPARKETPSGLVESVEVREFLTAGIHIRDGRHWRVRESRISNIGCHTDLPCPRLLKEDADRYIRGRKTVGYGVLVIGETASGAIVEDNRVSNVTKIGLEVFSQGSDKQLGRRPHHVQILRNRVSGSVASGIVSNGGVDIRIADNEVWDSGGFGVGGSGPAGIGCSGASERIEISGNFVHDTDGPGLRLNCGRDGMIVRSNRIERPCRVQLAKHGAIHIAGPKSGGAVLIVEGNHVDAMGSRCEYGLFISRWRNVRLINGEYRGGKAAALFLAKMHDVWLEGIGASTVNAPALRVTADSKGVRAAATLRIPLDAIKNDGDGRTFTVESP